MYAVVLGRVAISIRAVSQQFRQLLPHSPILISGVTAKDHAGRIAFDVLVGSAASWDRTWADELLYEKYGITKDEIGFINSVIRPMSEDDE